MASSHAPTQTHTHTQWSMTTRVTQQCQGVQPFLLPSLSFPSPTSTSYSQPVCHQRLCLPIISLLTFFLDFFHSQLVLLAESHPATASSLSENEQLRKRLIFFHFINPKFGNCTVAAFKITSKTELYYAVATNCKYFTLVSNTWMSLCAAKNQGRCARTVT